MQFDVYASPNADAVAAPLLVDIQADLLSALPTRLLVPLVPAGLFGRRVSRLHPRMTFRDENYVLSTHLLAALERGRIGRPIGSVAEFRDVIVAAIDVLLAGI